jgi:hypothetical protein
MAGVDDQDPVAAAALGSSAAGSTVPATTTLSVGAGLLLMLSLSIVGTTLVRRRRARQRFETRISDRLMAIGGDHPGRSAAGSEPGIAAPDGRGVAPRPVPIEPHRT